MQMQDVYLGFDTNVTLDRVNGAVGLSPPLTPYPVPPPPFSPAPFLRQRASSAAVKCKCKKFTSHIHIGLSAVSGVCGVRARCLGLVCRVALLLGDVQLFFWCYTEKAAPTRHRPERQHNARPNRRKQCSPNETKPYSKPTLPRKRQTTPTNGHTPRRWKPTHTRLTYTRMRPETVWSFLRVTHVVIGYSHCWEAAGDITLALAYTCIYMCACAHGHRILRCGNGKG